MLFRRRWEFMNTTKKSCCIINKKEELATRITLPPSYLPALSTILMRRRAAECKTDGQEDLHKVRKGKKLTRIPPPQKSELHKERFAGTEFPRKNLWCTIHTFFAIYHNELLRPRRFDLERREEAKARMVGKVWW